VLAHDVGGRLVVAVPADAVSEVVPWLERLRHSLLHKGGVVPWWLDELVDDGRRAAALASIGVSGIGQSVDTGGGLPGRWLSAPEVASLLGKSVRTITRMAESGRLVGAVRTSGGHWQVPLASLEQES
jgi:excisionase family DNA binding protein